MTPPLWVTWPYRYALCWVPLRDTEFLLRRIPMSWYKPRGEDRFGRVAFQPNQGDLDGISLYRERFVSAERVAMNVKREKQGTFYVVKLTVSDVRGCGLRARACVGDLPGHVVIPELARSALDENQEFVNEKGLELVRLAQIHIVIRPSIGQANSS